MRHAIPPTESPACRQAAPRPSKRTFPNILITGTPGTGKSTLCEHIVSAAQAEDPPIKLRYIDVGQWVKDQGWHEGWDEEYDTYIIDEVQLEDGLEPYLTSARGGLLLDTHSPSLFPPTAVDLVLVLRTSNDKLHPRLTERDYKPAKITENITAEIMQVILEEAVEEFGMDACEELRSETVEDVEINCKKVMDFLRQWRDQRSQQEGRHMDYTTSDGSGSSEPGSSDADAD